MEYDPMINPDMPEDHKKVKSYEKLLKENESLWKAHEMAMDRFFMIQGMMRGDRRQQVKGWMKDIKEVIDRMEIPND